MLLPDEVDALTEAGFDAGGTIPTTGGLAITALTVDPETVFETVCAGADTMVADAFDTVGLAGFAEG